MQKIFSAGPLCLIAVLAATNPVSSVAAQAPTAQTSPTYADLTDLADEAALVAHVKIRKQISVDAERAPDLQPGFARLYIEADTISLLTGSVPIGESLKYLVDLPVDSRGKAPKLKKREMIVFARPVTGRPGTVQLVGQGAQIAWTQEMDARLRPILAALVAPDAPPRVTTVRDALSVAGNLVGESETQLFLATEDDGPVSVTVIRRPGQAPTWGVSWTEIVDQAARPPEKNTLAWYRLACFLPAALPGEANLSRDPGSRAQAASDYRYVLQQLGPCERGRS